MGTIAIKAQVRGADRVVRQFATASARLPEDTLAAQRELGHSAEIVFGSYAPHRSGRLVRGIASTTSGGTVIVKDFATNPATGFDYVAVTRYGHAAIFPKQRFSASVLATGKRRGSGRTAHAPALRFVIGGRVVYAAYVKEWRPASDWVEDALPEIESHAELVAARLGHTVEAHF